MLDLNPNTVKSWGRRQRLRAQRDQGLHPNAYPAGADQAAPIFVPDQAITETHPFAYPSADQAGAPEYVPSETMADLLHPFSYLPGGRSPAFIATMEGLFLNAAAACDEWAETDPDLRALLAAD
ncbi:protein of unassigned function [Methylobacterium oryzae CBMB20]|uniref:Protein of unassigned function n=1 Tax=Methylobacterium oryzae CBMB20 TaxID=693986 RepID=A0A089NS70_9HYPH|nr:protein of unassigned function [Methylobacterium oryzae CBMB20]